MSYKRSYKSYKSYEFRCFELFSKVMTSSLVVGFVFVKIQQADVGFCLVPFFAQACMSRECGRRYCPSCTNDTALEVALVQTQTSRPAPQVSAMPTTGIYWSTTAKKRTWQSSATMIKNFAIPMQSPHRSKLPLAKLPMGVTTVKEYDLIVSGWPCITIV